MSNSDDNNVPFQVDWDTAKSEGPESEKPGASDEQLLEMAKVGLPARAITGFICVMNEEGQWVGSSRIDLASLVQYKREAGMGDLVHGAQSVAADAYHSRTVEMNAAATAVAFIQVMENKQRQLVEEQQAQMILQRTQRPPGGRRA